MAVNTSSISKESTLDNMVDPVFRDRYENPENMDLSLNQNKFKFSHVESASTAQINPLCPYGEHRIIDGLIQIIFSHHQSKSEWECIGVLACVNTHYNKFTTVYWEKLELKLVCPELRILDAKTQGITIYDEPIIPKWAIIKAYRDLAPHVENDEGLTLLTRVKGSTLSQLVAIAETAGMEVVVKWDKILQEDVPVEQTYVILITNNVFKESRKKTYALQKKLVEDEHGCEMPIVQEYVALCVLTNKCFQKCLYGLKTYGRSSTYVGVYPLAIGSSTPTRLEVCPHYSGDFASEPSGAGGRRKFRPIYKHFSSPMPVRGSLPPI